MGENNCLWTKTNFGNKQKTSLKYTEKFEKGISGLTYRFYFDFIYF